MSQLSALTNIGAMSSRRFLEINTLNTNRASEALGSGVRVSNPAYDPASASIGAALRSSNATLRQAIRNSSQAQALLQLGTGVLDSTTKVLEKMVTLSAQANSDTVGPGQRAMLNQEYLQLKDQLDKNVDTAVWGGVKLFSGGSGTATAQVNATAGVTGNGATVPANSINNGAATGLTGFVTGTVTDASARQTGPNQYELNVKVGEQTFRAFTRIPPATATEPIVFSGASDSYNSFSLAFVGSGAGITSETIFTNTLRSYFRLDTTTTAYKFTSVAQDATAITTLTVNPGSSTEPGLWALSYQQATAGNTGRFKLTNGVTAYYKDVTADTAGNMTNQTVTFNNGFSLTLGATFDGTAAFGNQAIYNVANGSSVDMQFQVGQAGTDLLTMTFNGITAATLGLTGVQIMDKSQAQTSLILIEKAQTSLFTSISSLGAVASQLEFTMDNLKVAVQNQEAARSTFIDANIGEELQNAQQSRALSDIASTTFTQALGDTVRLARMVQQAG